MTGRPAPLKHRLEYRLVRWAARLARILPLSAALGLGRFFGYIFFSVLGIRKAVALENLSLAFPDLGEIQKRTIARTAYQNFGMTFLELLMLDRMEPNSLARFEGDSFRDNAERGLVVATFHFGNWELLGKALVSAGLRLNVVVRRQVNALVDSYVNRARERAGMHVIYDTQNRKTLEAVRRGEAVGLLADQYPEGKSVTVDFLGRPTKYPAGPARIAIDYNIPLAVFFAVRTEPAKHRFICHVVRPAENDTITSLTRKYSDLLEEYLRRYPEQWFWAHR